jgi:hypothetical protein
LEGNRIIRFASRMDQLPPYLFGMINKMKIPIAPEKSFLDRIISICEACYPKPRVLMLNYPHNPTGVVIDREFFQEVVKLAKRFKFMIIKVISTMESLPPSR